MELEALRKEIDAVDNTLTELFVKRMQISSQIAQYKAEHGLPIENRQRELEVLTKRTEQAGEYAEYARSLFECLFDQSKKLQKNKMNNNDPEGLY